jgi:hypothetical protein
MSISENPAVEQTSADYQPIFDPETGWDRRVVNRVARSIRYAHDQNPSCWAIHTSEGEPFVALGKTNIAHLSRDSYQLLVDSNLLDDEDQKIADRLDIGRTYGSVSRKHLRLLGFKNKDVDTVLPRFEAAHESAIAGLTDQNSARNPWHQQAFVRELSRVIGEELPEPAYLADIPKLVDDNGKGKYLPEENWDVEMLKALSKTILEAHETNPKSWAVRFYQGEIILYIQMMKVMAISETSGHFLVSESPAHYIQSGFDKAHISVKKAFEHEASWMHTLDRDSFLSALDAYRTPHESIVGTFAASVKNKANRANQHQQQLVESISEITGIELPEPGYEYGKSLNSYAHASAPENPMAIANINPLSAIQQQFSVKGLTDSTDQITTFYTALQTKGFVVLSGISGTGKSKIAQHFVEMLPFSRTTPPSPDSLLSFKTNPVEH